MKRAADRTQFFRILTFFVLGVLAFVAPWWISFFGSVFVTLRFGWIEEIAIGFILDCLYGSGNFFGIAVGFFYTGILLLLGILRPLIRTYFFHAA